MPLTGVGAALVGGAFGIGSGVLNNYYNKKSASKAYQRQLAAQVMMMQNAHQWEVEDLKKAGLNPVLSANAGHAGGMGSVGMQAPSNIDASVTGRGLGQILDGQIEKTRNENRLIKAQADSAEANTENVKADTERKKEERTLLSKQIRQTEIANASSVAQYDREANFWHHTPDYMKRTLWLREKYGDGLWASLSNFLGDAITFSMRKPYIDFDTRRRELNSGRVLSYFGERRGAVLDKKKLVDELKDTYPQMSYDDIREAVDDVFSAPSIIQKRGKK